MLRFRCLLLVQMEAETFVVLVGVVEVETIATSTTAAVLVVITAAVLVATAVAVLVATAAVALVVTAVAAVQAAVSY
ncbi:MAG: hypothetical protein KME12_22960 [Trichocoleus desertorum ATA4-8-CV12]|nr:hypothetical protein [Trichocoleus desertorum ATA4-8-CV12]